MTTLNEGRPLKQRPPCVARASWNEQNLPGGAFKTLTGGETERPQAFIGRVHARCRGEVARTGASAYSCLFRLQAVHSASHTTTHLLHTTPQT